jgi:hypothetical protein
MAKEQKKLFFKNNTHEREYLHLTLPPLEEQLGFHPTLTYLRRTPFISSFFAGRLTSPKVGSGGNSRESGVAGLVFGRGQLTVQLVYAGTLLLSAISKDLWPDRNTHHNESCVRLLG